MAYLASGIYKKLKALAITPDVFNETAEQNPSYPLTVFDIIDEDSLGRSHDTGVQPFYEARVQVDVYAETIHAAETAVKAYKDALAHFDGALGVTGFENVSIRFANRNPGEAYKDEAALKTIVKRSLDFFVLY